VDSDFSKRVNLAVEESVTRAPIAEIAVPSVVDFVDNLIAQPLHYHPAVDRSRGPLLRPLACAPTPAPSASVHLWSLLKFKELISFNLEIINVVEKKWNFFSFLLKSWNEKLEYYFKKVVFPSGFRSNNAFRCFLSGYC
jgi:hypothetical protein